MNTTIKTVPISADFTLGLEMPNEAGQREALLDRAMGAARKRKSSEKLRRGRLPAEGLSFVARDEDGRVIGTVRLWNVATKSAHCGQADALLLGPLAVDPAHNGRGIGSALVRFAIEEARRLEHAAILLVGDAAYYQRFGFLAEKTGELFMPGPFEKSRLLALELQEGALAGATGLIFATGRRSATAMVQNRHAA